MSVVSYYYTFKLRVIENSFKKEELADIIQNTRLPVQWMMLFKLDPIVENPPKDFYWCICGAERDMVYITELVQRDIQNKTKGTVFHFGEIIYMNARSLTSRMGNMHDSLPAIRGNVRCEFLSKLPQIYSTPPAGPVALLRQ